MKSVFVLSVFICVNLWPFFLLFMRQIDFHTFMLHPRQWEVYTCPARFRILVAGRRFGKTYLALAEILRAAKGYNANVLFVGPTEDQTIRIIWKELKAATKPFWSKPPSESEKEIYLLWGSTIYVSGAFFPDGLRGVGFDLIVVDESATHRPNAWDEVFRPALTDRQGRALFIGSPKGRNYFYYLCEAAKANPAEWAVFQFTTEQGGLVEKSEIESVTNGTDEDTFRQEYGGQFDTVAKNRVYYAFHRDHNIHPVSFDGNHPLVWSLDFNVDPMCMLLIQRIEDIVHVLEEIVIRPSANTQAACEAFQKRAALLDKYLSFNQRPLQVHIYGDASGAHRRTSACETDWTIIRNFFTHWRGVFNPFYFTNKSNPAVRDRVNCVNTRLRSQSQESRMLIHPSCTELLKDLEEVTWLCDSLGSPTNEIKKADKNRTHASDALGYYISQAFPMKPPAGYNDSGRLL
jgi:hypothetical protein